LREIVTFRGIGTFASSKSQEIDRKADWIVKNIGEREIWWKLTEMKEEDNQLEKGS
jgi:hypothetical protein